MKPQIDNTGLRAKVSFLHGCVVDLGFHFDWWTDYWEGDEQVFEMRRRVRTLRPSFMANIKAPVEGKNYTGLWSSCWGCG
jgi:hypothetical protein